MTGHYGDVLIPLSWYFLNFTAFKFENNSIILTFFYKLHNISPSYQIYIITIVACGFEMRC